MSRKGPRGLTPDEQALWNKVAEHAIPLHPKKHVPLPEQVKRPKPPNPAPAPLPSFQIGETKQSETADFRQTTNGKPAPPIKMDRRQFGQLKRGKLMPEARIDLHGMILAQAHPALTNFILDAHADGLRLVLVITGKGKDKLDDGPIPVRKGVLKHQLPHWLNTAPLTFAVLQVSEAHLKHGGSGAYYVYLRRRR